MRHGMPQGGRRATDATERDRGARLYEGPMNPPRVTDILKEAGLIDTTWFTDHARDRGTAVHLACQYDDEGTLDDASVTDELKGYLAAYRKWKAQSGRTTFAAAETRIVHPSGLYSGSPDRISDNPLAEVWDIKTGSPLPWHPIQLAAYANLMPYPYSYRRFTLYLKEDGTYTVKEYPISETVHDLSVFMACLTLHNWKLTH